MMAPPAAALLLTGLWLCLALVLPKVPRRWRGTLRWLLVAAGVPAVGWLTLLWGPGIGTGGLALGLLALLGSRTPRRPRTPTLPPLTGPQGEGPA